MLKAVAIQVFGAPEGLAVIDPAEALRAPLDRTPVLTGGERRLPQEPLDRVADGD